MKKLKIRTKLTIWYLIIIIAIIAVMMFYIYFTMYGLMKNQDKQAILNDWDYALSKIHYSNNTLSIDDKDIDTDILFALYNANGNIVYMNIPKGLSLNIAFQNYSIQTVDSEGKTWYLYDSPVSSNGQIVGGIRVVRLQPQFNNTLYDLVVVMAAFTPICIIVVVVGGYFITKKSFKPVSEMIGTAQRIGAGDLSRRIKNDGNDEIGELSRAIDDMLELIQTSFEKEKQFAANASHELRTPLAVIMAQAEETLRGKKKADEYKEALYTIYSQSKDMSKMVSQMLSIAQSKENTINLENTNISLIAKSVAEEMQLAFPSVQIRSCIQPDIFMFADQMLITRLIMNLIDNAIKFNDKDNAIVELSLFKDRRRISFKIEDNGCGIDKKDYDNIFKRYYTVKEKRENSSGVGLYIVKWIVNLHGGTITLKSELGRGSTFEIIFKDN